MTYSAINSSGVHVVWSASGINFLFIGVSSVTLKQGKIFIQLVLKWSEILTKGLGDAILFFKRRCQGTTYGRIAVTVALEGKPPSAEPRLLVNWCTAAFAIPYPIIPIQEYHKL